MKSENNEITIAKLEPGSAADIVSLHRAAFDLDHLGHTVFASPQADALIADWLQDPDHVFRGAFRDSDLAGYTQLRDVDSRSHLNNIAVAPNYQGSGVGLILLTDAIKTSLAMGFSELTLDVAERNDKSRRWYRKYGFRDDTTRLAFIASARNTDGGKVETAEVRWLDEQVKKRDDYGVAEFQVRIGTETYDVGVIGANVFRIVGAHSQALIDVLHELEPFRRIVIFVPSKSELNCDARLIETTHRMVKSL